MKILLILLVVFAVTKAKYLFDDSQENDDITDYQLNFISVDKISDFAEKNVGEEFEMLQMYSGYRGQISYSAGARQRGDRLVGTASNNQHWPRPQDVAIEVKYPTKGTGALVTYISFNISQSTNLGQAYITKGGIHQRNITLVVEALGTTFVNYVCNIFGL
uniref:Putative transcription activator mbf2 n=1 Tax=Nyssomyia neivai TaxID=330878 RepID=A0A1L8DFZ9_9DIPT